MRITNSVHNPYSHINSLTSNETREASCPSIGVGPLCDAPFVPGLSAPLGKNSVLLYSKYDMYLGLAQELSRVGLDILDKNKVSVFFGEKLEAVSSAMAGLELGVYHALASVYSAPMRQVDLHCEEHVQWAERKAESLTQAFSEKVHGVDPTLLQTKLNTLLKWYPRLSTVLENSLMSTWQAAVWSPVLSQPSKQEALESIDELHQQLVQHQANGLSDKEIQQALQARVNILQSKGSLLGRLSHRIQQNPSNMKAPLNTTIAKWLSQGRALQFNEPVVFGLVNQGVGVENHQKQPMLDALLSASGVDVSDCPLNIPVVVKIRGDQQAFESNVLNGFRERLLVSQKVSVVSPGQIAADAREVDLKQAPLIPALEHILCGRYEMVHPDVLGLLDQADIFEVSCSQNESLAVDLQSALRNPSTPVTQSLKRAMVARLLLPALCLEGTSIKETARNLTPPTLVGIGLDVGKNYIPEGYAVLKTVVMQAFFLGVDAVDNMAGAWPEVQSLLETMGIQNVDYQTVFAEPAPESKAAKAKEFLKLALGLRSAEGEAGSTVATALRSVAIGTIVGNLLTLGYTSAIGALDLNPGLRALVGMPAILGTSLGIALNFSVNHADLSLAFKKQIHDGVLKLPDSIPQNDPIALNKYCSGLAKRQLMLLSGTGPAAEAFALAPLASLLNLLGYGISMHVVEAVVTPVMPGMENLVRLVAMSKHGKGVEGGLAQFDEKLLARAEQGQMAVLTDAEFEHAMYGKLGHISADITLAVGGLLMGFLGRKGFHQLQIASDSVDIEAVVGHAHDAVARLRQASRLVEDEQAQPLLGEALYGNIL